MTSPRSNTTKRTSGLLACILAGSLALGACGAAEEMMAEQLAEAAMGGDVDVEFNGDDSIRLEGDDGTMVMGGDNDGYTMTTEEGTFVVTGGDDGEMVFTDDDGTMVMGAGQDIPADYAVPLPGGLLVESFIDMTTGEESASMLFGTMSLGQMGAMKAHFDAFASTYSDADVVDLGSPEAQAYYWASESGEFMITAGAETGDEIEVMVITGNLEE